VAVDGGRERVTACLIVRDEERRLPGCLESVAFCDSIVVVDSGSRDRTAAIARSAGVRVVESEWRGFAQQRNIALDLAESEWILEIDADERVTPQLRREIQRFLADPPPEIDLVALPLRDILLGKPLGPAARYPRYRYRLFRRKAYRHDVSREVHEGLWPNGEVLALDGDLQHTLAESLTELIRDTWRYAQLEAAMLPPPRTRRAYLRGVIARPAAKAVYRLLVLGGWGDGWRGVLRIASECVGDATVWLLVARRTRLGLGSSAEHFAESPPSRGPVRIVGLAAGGDRAHAAALSLGRARAAGADVTLVTDSPAAADDVPVRPVNRVGPLTVARMLDREQQLRPIDHVVPFGRREALLLRLVPHHLRGALPAAPDDDPVRLATARLT
jgi:Glycosyl transferase family 2